MCSGLVYQKDTCLCHMDQCLEAVRYSHIEMCGTTTLPKKVATPQPQPGDDAEGSGGGGGEGSGSGDSSNSGAVDPSEFILDLSEEELLLIYAEMFNHVTFLLSHESISSFLLRPKLV